MSWYLNSNCSVLLQESAVFVANVSFFFVNRESSQVKRGKAYLGPYLASGNIFVLSESQSSKKKKYQIATILIEFHLQLHFYLRKSVEHLFRLCENQLLEFFLNFF